MCALGAGMLRGCVCHHVCECVCSCDASIALSALDIFSQFKAENFFKLKMNFL